MIAVAFGSAQAVALGLLRLHGTGRGDWRATCSRVCGLVLPLAYTIISIEADALVSVRRGNLRLQAGIDRMVAHNL
jgi:hypothetical protein